MYELTLKKQCGYNGSLVYASPALIKCVRAISDLWCRYWDWSLDWEDLTLSPVWDSDTGFGGNGNSSDEKSVAHGSCVTDGPFARLVALFWGVEDKPHCLSRGFAKHEKVKKFGLKVKPEALQKLLEEPDYDSFNLGLENGPHDTIPSIVRGDFYKVTAPNGMFPSRLQYPNSMTPVLVEESKTKTSFRSNFLPASHRAGSNMVAMAAERSFRKAFGLRWKSCRKFNRESSLDEHAPRE